jgi:hypothetical protein
MEEMKKREVGVDLGVRRIESLYYEERLTRNPAEESVEGTPAGL